ncbi:hypothetical protein WH240_06305 [Gluconobacter wancherniae]|uniref:hypothetical protein n=1 Tax=Gluconobacter wancherniae TaxID=1307955 RepID=UPI00309EED0C
MHLEQKTGPIPGRVFSTFRRGMTTRTFQIEVRQTDAGYYIARMPDQKWSVECQTAEAALLMHAEVLFPTQYSELPWLDNPQPAPSHYQRHTEELARKSEAARSSRQKKILTPL